MIGAYTKLKRIYHLSWIKNGTYWIDGNYLKKKKKMQQMCGQSSLSLKHKLIELGLCQSYHITIGGENFEQG